MKLHGIYKISNRITRKSVHSPKKSDDKYEKSNKYVRLNFHQSNHIFRVASYHPSQDSLTFPWFFPDILQFSRPSDRSKENHFNFYFNGANCIISSFGLHLKERICSLGEQILSFKSNPQWGGRGTLTISWQSTSFPLLNRTNKIFWRLPAIVIYFQIPRLFPDFPSPF